MYQRRTGGNVSFHISEKGKCPYYSRYFLKTNMKIMNIKMSKGKEQATKKKKDSKDQYVWKDVPPCS